MEEALNSDDWFSKKNIEDEVLSDMDRQFKHFEENHK